MLKQFLLIFSVVIFSTNLLSAQCLHYSNIREMFSMTVNETGKFLKDNNWVEGKPNASNKFGRSMKSWSLNNVNGAVCWLDVCYKSGAKNILVYQFISPTNYSAIKEELLADGFVQKKFKITEDDIILAFTKDDLSFILRKHTYGHKTEGNYALLHLASKDLEGVWTTYTK